MSDPKKNFVCSKCGYIINDGQRHAGKHTPCPGCMQNEIERKIENDKKQKNSNCI